MMKVRTRSKKGGYCYCIRANEFYKIGVTTNLHQRLERLVPQCPFMLTYVHFIHTDDMYAMENFWHRRFSDKRKTGEWFKLTKTDLAHFMKYKHATINKAGRFVALDQTKLTELIEESHVHVQNTRSSGKVPKKMPVAEKGVEQLCSEGTHYMQLQPVVTDRVNSKFSKDPDGKSEIYYWKFISKSVNPETGERESIRVMTDAVVTPNNNQAKMWKMLMPELSKTPFLEWSCDTEKEVEGKWFEVVVRHEQKGDKTYANAAFIKPYKKPTPAPKPAAVAETPVKAAPVASEEPEDGEDIDPFSDEM